MSCCDGASQSAPKSTATLPLPRAVREASSVRAVSSAVAASSAMLSPRWRAPFPFSRACSRFLKTVVLA